MVDVSQWKDSSFHAITGRSANGRSTRTNTPSPKIQSTLPTPPICQDGVHGNGVELDLITIGQETEKDSPLHSGLVLLHIWEDKAILD